MMAQKETKCVHCGKQTDGAIVCNECLILLHGVIS